MTATVAAPATVDGCVLFTDLVGFTTYTEVAGDAEAVSLLDAQVACTRAVLAAWPAARVVKELGDGLLIWCGEPGSGVGIGVELRRAFAEARSGGFPLPVRMGMHCGSVTTRGDDLVGHTVNVAARIAQLAGPDELVVSEEVLRSCGDTESLDLQPLGPTTVKGVSEAVWLYRVVV